MKKNMFLIIIILTSINLFGQNPPLYPRAWVNGEIITHYNDDKSVMINNEIKLLENQIPELIVITEKADTIFKYCVKNKITTEFERSLGSIEMFDTFNGHYRIIFIFKYDVDDYENKCDNYRANAIIIANVESSKGNKSHLPWLPEKLCEKDYRYYKRKRIEYGNVFANNNFTDVLTIDREKYYQKLNNYYQELKEYENKADSINNKLDVLLKNK